MGLVETTPAGVLLTPPVFCKPTVAATPSLIGQPKSRPMTPALIKLISSTPVVELMPNPTSPMYKSPVALSKLARQGFLKPVAMISPSAGTVPELVGLAGVVCPTKGLVGGMAKFLKLLGSLGLLGLSG